MENTVVKARGSLLPGNYVIPMENYQENEENGSHFFLSSLQAIWCVYIQEDSEYDIHAQWMPIFEML